MDHANVLRCGEQLKGTLAAVHIKGHGHNDVKASNVFITSDGELWASRACACATCAFA